MKILRIHNINLFYIIYNKLVGIYYNNLYRQRNKRKNFTNLSLKKSRKILIIYETNII